MKNILMILTLVLLGTFASQSYAGECSGGACNLLNRSVRKVVVVTKNVIVAPINITKDIIKYQPVRRRLVHRSTNCVSCQ